MDNPKTVVVVENSLLVVLIYLNFLCSMLSGSDDHNLHSSIPDTSPTVWSHPTQHFNLHTKDSNVSNVITGQVQDYM